MLPSVNKKRVQSASPRTDSSGARSELLVINKN